MPPSRRWGAIDSSEVSAPAGWRLSMTHRTRGVRGTSPILMASLGIHHTIDHPLHLGRPRPGSDEQVAVPPVLGAIDQATRVAVERADGAGMVADGLDHQPGAPPGSREP